MADEMFKTTLMGGFDKDDVLNRVQMMQDEAFAEKSKLLKRIKEKDAKIAELNRQLLAKDIEKQDALESQKLDHEQETSDLRKRLEEKQEQKERLEREISVKYQKYIDHYDLIGGLILEAREKADRIVKEAEEKRDSIMIQAQEEAQKCLDVVQKEVDDKLAEGKRKYIAVQEEMNEIVELINQAQRRFMSSYKEVHKIISTMPESMKELEDEAETTNPETEEQAVPESIPEIPIPEDADYDEEDSLDEADEDLSQEELLSLLNKED